MSKEDRRKIGVAVRRYADAIDTPNENIMLYRLRDTLDQMCDGMQRRTLPLERQEKALLWRSMIQQAFIDRNIKPTLRDFILASVTAHDGGLF